MRILDFPWKTMFAKRQIAMVAISNVFDRAATFYYTQVNRLNLWLWCGQLEKGFRATGTLFIRNRGELRIGREFRFNSGRRINVVGGNSRMTIWIGRDASLHIGNSVGISNATIVCQDRISIGNNVLIGGGCEIFDTDFHPLLPSDRADPQKRPNTSPIYIGNDVFVGAGTTILKGVTIGDGAVIGAKSLVTKDIPAFEVWGGSPARRLRASS